MLPLSRTISTVCTLVLLGALTACGGGTDTPVGPDPNAATSVEIDPFGHAFNAIGATQKFVAKARNDYGETVNGQSFTFTSSSPSVASVSSSGVVTSVGPGATTITATLSGGTLSAAVPVTVWQAVASFTLSPVTTTLSVGGSLQIAVTAVDPQGAKIESPTLIYGSLGETIATVSSSGLITGVAPGTTTITAMSNVQLAGVVVTVVKSD